ncbi:MAG TPA: hypothetical protein VJG32_03485 [Anaerolineae bacterium]|nr:hypothetical protein [Anaerolineae bacterium]
MDTGQFLLLGGVILIGALLVAGGALAGLRSRRRNEESGDDPFKPAAAETPRIEAAAPAPPKREPAIRLSEWQRKLPPDVVVLHRDSASGEWVVEIEGQRYRRLSDIHDDKAATKILSAIEGLKVFAGLTATALAEPAPAAAQPTPGQPESAALPAPPVGPRKLRSATYPAPEGSIISQIETILQRELTLHPEFGNRAIHMGAAPDGGLLIEVDTNFYKSPDDIPDPRVRALVMLAVRTWEKSS